MDIAGYDTWKLQNPYDGEYVSDEDEYVPPRMRIVGYSNRWCRATVFEVFGVFHVVVDSRDVFNFADFDMAEAFALGVVEGARQRAKSAHVMGA